MISYENHHEIQWIKEQLVLSTRSLHLYRHIHSHLESPELAVSLLTPGKPTLCLLTLDSLLDVTQVERRLIVTVSIVSHLGNLHHLRQFICITRDQV